MTDAQVFYDGPIVKRAEANDEGLRFFFTGKVCLAGHIDQRYTSSGSCVQCKKDGWVAGKPEGYSENTIYIGQIVTLDEARRGGYDRYFTGIACKNGHIDERYTSNGVCVSCNANSISRWRSKDGNRQKTRDCARSWRGVNADKVKSMRRNRRASIKNAEGTHTSDDIAEIYDRQNGVCAEPTCGKDLTDGYHVDHIMPLALGGTNWPSNLQCLCPTCNLRKHAKHPIDWARENGRLL